MHTSYPLNTYTYFDTLAYSTISSPKDTCNNLPLFPKYKTFEPLRTRTRSSVRVDKKSYISPYIIRRNIYKQVLCVKISISYKRSRTVCIIFLYSYFPAFNGKGLDLRCSERLKLGLSQVFVQVCEIKQKKRVSVR